MRRAGFALLLVLAASPAPARADVQCEPGAIYLVRHAEKAPAGDDPDVPLSAQGHATAAALAAWFEQRGLQRVFATHLRRTQQTAMPVAQAKALPVSVYPADATALLVGAVRQACGEDVLVVGHSNTVPDIAAAFGAAPFTIAEDAFGTVWWRAAGSTQWRSAQFAAPR